MHRLLVVVALLAAAPAGAQGITLKDCLKIQEDGARLKCYDAIAAAMPAPGTPAQPDGALPVGWKFERKEDAMRDTPTLIATILADDKNGMLIVRCTDKKELELYASWLKFLGMDSARVTWRFDSGKPETESWSLSTDKRATFARDPMKIHVPITLGARKLALQTTPYNSSPVTMTFDLTAGDVKALPRVLYGCGALRQDPDAAP